MDQTADALYAEATPEQRAECDKRKGKTTYLSLKLQVKERSWVVRTAAALEAVPLFRNAGYIFDSCVSYGGNAAAVTEVREQLRREGILIKSSPISRSVEEYKAFVGVQDWTPLSPEEIAAHACGVQAMAWPAP